MTPIPIQRSRKKKYPECGHTLTVTRPGIFGNPYRVVEHPGIGDWQVQDRDGSYLWSCESEQEAAEVACDFFRYHLEILRHKSPNIYAGILRLVRSADYIACWCKTPDMDGYTPCHREVYIELAQEQP